MERESESAVVPIKRILLFQLNSIRVDRSFVRSRSRTCSRTVASADPEGADQDYIDGNAWKRAQTGNPPRGTSAVHIRRPTPRFTGANNRPVGANPTEAFPTGAPRRSDSLVYHLPRHPIFLQLCCKLQPS